MQAVTLRHVRQMLLVVLLETVAVFLALYQGLSGVQTDEAKYLLNIPYPHPPLARTAFHVLEAIPFQEMFIRIVLATLLFQAVWLIADMAKTFTVEKRMTLCGLWLFSGAVLFQAGTVMMAPLTALQGLVFVWLLHREDIARKYVGLVALLWLASLFTAYQAILFAPIVAGIFWRQNISVLRKYVALGLPVGLVLLYIATNPLALASFTNAGTQNAALAAGSITSQTLYAWLFAGSGVFSLVGTYALMRSKNIMLIASFALVVAFLCVSFRMYYAILFLPLFIGGAVFYPSSLAKPASVLAMQIMAAVYVFSAASLSFYENSARTVMRVVNQVPAHGAVLISGSFGHQWQYESTAPVYRFRTDLLSKAKAVVCLDSCPNFTAYGLHQIRNLDLEVWIR